MKQLLTFSIENNDLPKPKINKNKKPFAKNVNVSNQKKDLKTLLAKMRSESAQCRLILHKNCSS